MSTSTSTNQLTTEELLHLSSLCAAFEKVEEGATGNIKEKILGLTKDKVTFNDLIAIMPEDQRPTIISVPDTDVMYKSSFLLQLKFAPTCAFIVAAHNRSTKWRVQASYGPLKIDRTLPCFCCSCIQTEEGEKSYMRAIASQCRAHGIKTVFGRHCNGGIGNVSFVDGGLFAETMSKLGINVPDQRIWIS